MFPASTAMSPPEISSAMPRQTQQPLRRVAGALIAAVTVLALLAASAVPARADRQGDTVAKALVATIAVAAIVHSINKGRAKPAPAPVPQPTVQVRSPRVPSVCAIEISGARRDVTVYPERCLRRQGFEYRLPRHCANEARVFGRTDRVYSEDCLRNAGFRVDGGRFEKGRGHDRGYHDHGRGRERGWDNGRDFGRDFGHGRPRHAY
ncbi:MAG: hypothetical protein ACK4GC_11365 [Paracoccaceae bacterium]